MNQWEIIIDNNYNGFNPVQFGYEECKPNHSFGPAVRNHWLLHFVNSGTGIFVRDGNTYNVAPGEIFVIPPYKETFYKADSEKPWHYTWIGFETDQPLPDVFQKPVIKFAGLDNVFEEMRNCRKFENGKSAYLSAKLWELMAIILDAGKTEPDCIEKAIHCINSEYMNDLTVSGLAQRFGLDRCYFSTLFTKTVGVSPSQYLIELRLKKAADLMLNYGESPSVAAMSVGYTDIYNFSKSFKKKYGLSPRQYIDSKK